MKKALSLLILLLCLMLTACQSAENTAVEAAHQDTAQSQSTPDDCEDTQETLPASEPQADPYAHLYGTWINMYNNNVYTLASGGAGTVDGESFSFALEGETLTISGEEEPIVLSIVEEDSIYRMFSSLHRIYLVPEDSAEALAPVAIEITLDNWEEYFLICPIPYNYSINTYGMAQQFWGVFLKEEYCDKMMDVGTGEWQEIPVYFSMKDEYEYYEYQKNASGEFTHIQVPSIPHNYHVNSSFGERRNCLTDLRTSSTFTPSSEFPSPVYYWGWYMEKLTLTDSRGLILYAVGTQVTDVQGTIHLIP